MVCETLGSFAPRELLGRGWRERGRKQSAQLGRGRDNGMRTGGEQFVSAAKPPADAECTHIVRQRALDIEMAIADHRRVAGLLAEVDHRLRDHLGLGAVTPLVVGTVHAGERATDGKVGNTL